MSRSEASLLCDYFCERIGVIIVHSTNMKTFFSFFIVIVLTNYSLAQKELVNVYNSYSEVYSGMEDGGISRNESFVFVAFATVEIKNIWLNNEKIILAGIDLYKME